jgi:hypothetical protein
LKKKDPKAITWLFERFSIIWGQKWDKYHDEKPELIANEWTDALAGKSRQTIKQGLSKARQALTWPPSIAEFLQACQGTEIDTGINRHTCAIPCCSNTATMCRSPYGSNWVCNRHFQEGKG